jgi:hypothetical protein
MKESHMSYLERDDYGMYKNKHGKGPGPELMGAHTLLGDHVHNLQNEHLGVIKEFMVDMRSGTIAYAVMSTSRFLGLAGIDPGSGAQALHHGHAEGTHRAGAGLRYRSLAGYGGPELDGGSACVFWDAGCLSFKTP